MKERTKVGRANGINVGFTIIDGEVERNTPISENDEGFPEENSVNISTIGVLIPNESSLAKEDGNLENGSNQIEATVNALLTLVLTVGFYAVLIGL